MSELIKIAVDAMGGDGSPKKVVDGIIYFHKKIKKMSLKFLAIKMKLKHIDNKIIKFLRNN